MSCISGGDGVRNSCRQTAFVCPFYTGDDWSKRKNSFFVCCAGGQKLTFASEVEMRRWVERLCGNLNGWERCSVAQMLWERYE